MIKKLLLMIFVFAAFSSSAQQQIINHYSWLTPTELPYNGDYNDKVLGSQSVYWFAYDLWGAKILNSNVWTDLGLTVSESEDPTEGWPTSGLYRTFSPTNGSYKLCAVNIGSGDYGKTMLISIGANGNYIDAIEIAASMAIAPDGTVVYPKQWRIDSNMKVIVYQLKPVSSTPIMYNKSILFPVQSQRIDKVYQIDSIGHFSLLSQTDYQPKSYTLINYSDPNYNIWQGNETPQ